MFSNVLICGGTGFLGSHLADVLREMGCKEVTSVGAAHADLVEPRQACSLVRTYRPSHVFNLAGRNGGLAWNAAYPLDIFYLNTVANLNLLRACAELGVKKVVSTVASCAYGNHTHGWQKRSSRAEGVLFEGEFLDGIPHESVACHGYARRNVFLASYFAAQQLNLNAVCACPPTLYGPRDHFEPDRTKFVGAMVKRYCDAIRKNAGEVVCWGSGKPLREVCYVRDCAKLLVEVMSHYEDTTHPLNIGTGQEVSVSQLAGRVSELTGYQGQTKWDTSKPDGQMKKKLDLSRMKEFLPTQPEPTPLKEGLQRTIEYYRQTAFH